MNSQQRVERMQKVLEKLDDADALLNEIHSRDLEDTARNFAVRRSFFYAVFTTCRKK